MHVSKEKNLYLPGLRPNGSPRTLVALDGFWGQQSSDQKRGGKGDAFLPDLLKFAGDRLGLGAVVVIDQVNKFTGEIESRTITHNVVTDNGAQNMLKAFTGSAPALGQYLALDTNAASTTLSAALTAATTLSTAGLTVGSGGNPSAVSGNKASQFLSNTTSNPCTSGAHGSADATTGGGVVIGYGLATADYASGSATMTATNIGIAAGVNQSAHAIGEWVVANPQVSDGPAAALPATAIIYNSGASTNAATGTATPAAISGTGIGNRQAQFTATFGTSSTAGTYNNLWVVTASTLAANTAAANYLTHLSFDGKGLNGSSQISVTYTVKL